MHPHVTGPRPPETPAARRTFAGSTGLLLRVVLPCLLPLTACGPVANPAGPTPVTSASAPGSSATTASPIPASTVPGSTVPGSPAPSPRPAPATSADALVPPVPLPGVTVVLDPGHNGANASHLARIDRPVPAGRGDTKPCNTTGTGTDAGYPEATFNWEVALLVRNALTARGVRVVLTRRDNSGVGPCVNDRAATANRAGAVAMVSIHADGAARSGHGFHVAYSDPPLNASQGAPSLRLAEALAGAMRRGGFTAADYIGSAGLDPRSDLAGLNLAEVPAALVECANMRNPKEAALVSTPAGRARYAAAIADGIVTWLGSAGIPRPDGG